MRTIRPAREEDEAATVALWRACGLVTSYNDPHAEFRFTRAGAAAEVLVAEGEGGRVVGSVMGSWLSRPGPVPGRGRA